MMLGYMVLRFQTSYEACNALERIISLSTGATDERELNFTWDADAGILWRNRPTDKQPLKESRRLSRISWGTKVERVIARSAFGRLERAGIARGSGWDSFGSA
jgi:hypothetical protein